MHARPGRQLGHLAGNRPYLAISVSLADHEEVRDGGPTPKVDPDYGAGPAGQRGVSEQATELKRRHARGLSRTR